MATHRLGPERRTLHGHFSRDLPPALIIDPGDTVLFRTLEAGWRSERPAAPTFDAFHAAPRVCTPLDPHKDSGHALTGPVYVRGAEPGMTLEVEIERLVPADWGWTVAGGWPHEVNRRLGLDQGPGAFLIWDIDAATRTARDDKGRAVRIRPFLGVMGNAPDEPGVLPTPPPRSVGGNLDCKELIAGTRLLLPVAVPGALFSCGDGHAAQGDGEASVTALECPMEEAKLTFRLRPDLRLSAPRAETAEGTLAFGLSEDLDEATFRALEGILDVLQERRPELSRAEALALASVAVDLRVTQIVNGVKGVHAVLPHGAITF